MTPQRQTDLEPAFATAAGLSRVSGGVMETGRQVRDHVRAKRAKL
jgi:hypothetical protein